MRHFVHGFPARYIQGPGVLAEVGEVAAGLGKRALVMADEVVRGLTEATVSDSLDHVGLRHDFVTFAGECTRAEFSRISDLTRKLGADIVIAVGGGKTLDAGKAAASLAGAEMISCPTVASTDAPVSSLAVEYDDNHAHVGAIFFDRGPAAVLVDSQLIAQAPPRLLAAGMGDALATWYEARACAASGTRNFFGGGQSEVGLTLARLCRNVIVEHGRAAFQAVTANRVDEPLEKVIEANTFLSGVGFENSGVAGAHALDGALSHFERKSDSQHGERVALGILMQLILEGDREEIALLEALYRDVGLPCRLRDIGLDDLAEAEISSLAARVAREGSLVHNLPFPVSAEMVASALTELK